MPSSSLDLWHLVSDDVQYIPRLTALTLLSLVALEAGFAPYIQAFLPFLYPALKAHEDTQLCTVAVGIIGDISRALGEQSAPYAEPFMTVLLENLQSEVLNRNVKISVLSCFGDIALAIGQLFGPFLETTMAVLKQAGAVEPNPVCFFLFLFFSFLWGFFVGRSWEFVVVAGL